MLITEEMLVAISINTLRVQSDAVLRGFQSVDWKRVMRAFRKAYPNGAKFEEIQDLSLELAVGLVRRGVIKPEIITKQFEKQKRG
jgi:hypothetical protein